MVVQAPLDVLLIEDDPDTRIEILEELKDIAAVRLEDGERSLRVRTLPTGTADRVPGREAVQTELAQHPPHLILLDLSWSRDEDVIYRKYGLEDSLGRLLSPSRIPVMLHNLPGGVRFLVEHGNDPRYAIVVLTAHAYPELVLLLRRLGAVAVLAKRELPETRRTAPVLFDEAPDGVGWLEKALRIAATARARRLEQRRRLKDATVLEPAPGYPYGLVGKWSVFMDFLKEIEAAADDGSWRVLHVSGPPHSERREAALKVITSRQPGAGITWLREEDLCNGPVNAAQAWGVELPGGFSALGWPLLAERLPQLAQGDRPVVLVTGEELDDLLTAHPAIQLVLDALEALSPAARWRRIRVPRLADRQPDRPLHVLAALERVRREFFLPWLDLDASSENRLARWQLQWTGLDDLEEVLRRAAPRVIESILSTPADSEKRLPVGVEPFLVPPDDIPEEDEYLRNRLVTTMVDMVDKGWRFKKQLDGLEDAVVRRVWERARGQLDQTAMAEQLGYTLPQLRTRLKRAGLIR